MQTNQHLRFPITIDYRGSEVRIKGIKCTYPGNGTMYKIAMPSFLCDAPVCWITGSGKQWHVVLGQLPDKELEKTLLTAICDLEKIHTIPLEKTNAKLQSA